MDNRRELQELQIESMKNTVKIQEIVMKHLEHAIEQRDSATVAAMAEILRD